MASMNKTRTAGLCALVLAGCLYLALLFVETRYMKLRFLPFSPDATDLAARRQLLRVQHMRNACADQIKDKDNLSYRNNYTRYFTNTSAINYFYPNFNIAYCKVPKVACTFMAHMLVTLERGYTDDATLNLSRAIVHKGTKSYVRNNQTEVDTNQAKSRTVFAVRNPFSRLYSAYVDKIFLPNMYSVSLEIQQGLLDGNSPSKSPANCSNDVTFQQFLDSVVRRARSDKKMSTHWAPITTLCQPCSLDKYIIIKQETFTEDIEAFLKSINVTGSMYDNIQAIMTSKRIESTIPGIVQVVHDHARNIKNCLSDVQLRNKLWVSFQIQGYISEDRKFPSEKFNHMVDKESVAYFSDFMVREAKESNLTRTQSKAQRNDYLVRAYKDISFDTIEEIKKIYRSDFLLFDYSMTPPA